MKDLHTVATLSATYVLSAFKNEQRPYLTDYQLRALAEAYLATQNPDLIKREPDA